MKLAEYLTLCFNVFRNKCPFPTGIVKISLCCAHVVKNLFNIVDEYTENTDKKTKNVIKSMLAVGFNVSNDVEATEWF